MVAGGTGELVAVAARLGQPLAPGLDEVAADLGYLTVADHSRWSGGDANTGAAVSRGRPIAHRETHAGGDVGRSGQGSLRLSNTVAASGRELAIIGGEGMRIGRKTLVSVLIHADVVYTGAEVRGAVLWL